MVLMLPSSVHLLQVVWMEMAHDPISNCVYYRWHILFEYQAYIMCTEYECITLHYTLALSTYRLRHGLLEGTLSPTWYIVAFPVSLLTEHTDGRRDEHECRTLYWELKNYIAFNGAAELYTKQTMHTHVHILIYIWCTNYTAYILWIMHPRI